MDLNHIDQNKNLQLEPTDPNLHHVSAESCKIVFVHWFKTYFSRNWKGETVFKQCEPISGAPFCWRPEPCTPPLHSSVSVLGRTFSHPSQYVTGSSANWAQFGPKKDFPGLANQKRVGWGDVRPEEVLEVYLLFIMSPCMRIRYKASQLNMSTLMSGFFTFPTFNLFLKSINMKTLFCQNLIWCNYLNDEKLLPVHHQTSNIQTVTLLPH